MISVTKKERDWAMWGQYTIVFAWLMCGAQLEQGGWHLYFGACLVALNAYSHWTSLKVQRSIAARDALHELGRLD